MSRELFSRLTETEALFVAWQKVRVNGGGPGADGVSLDEFALSLEDSLRDLREELTAGSYQPLPTRRVRIPEPDKERPIDIRAVRDRIVETAAYNLLMPIWEPHFPVGVYGYRPGRSALTAADRVGDHLKSGLGWVMETDIALFFELCRIRHNSKKPWTPSWLK